MAANNGGNAVEVKKAESSLPTLADFFEWEPYDFMKFRPSLRSFFDWPTFFKTAASPAASAFSFDVDLKQKDGKYVAECSLPGFKKDDIDIQVRGKSVTVSAKTQGETKEERADYVYRERHTGEYHRTISFPVDLDPKKVEASYKDGILEITVPAALQTRPEKIEIKG